MFGIQIKKFIALAMTMLFVVLAAYGFITNKVTFAEVSTVIVMVIGYYFGHRNGTEEK